MWRGFDEGVSSGTMGDTKEALIPDVEPDDWLWVSNPLGNTKIDSERRTDLRR